MTDRTHRPPRVAPLRPGDSDPCPDEALRRVRGLPPLPRHTRSVRTDCGAWDDGPVVPKIPRPRPATPFARKGGLS